MKNYELTVLFHPDLEMNLDPALDKVKKIIKSNGGKIVKEENDGKKRLSYTISGQEYAMFYFFDVELPSAAPVKISNTLNIADEVLRYLLVKTDQRKARLEAMRKEAKTTKEEDKSNQSSKEDN